MKLVPPYTPISQKPYCCVPACISMILDRRKISHGTQDEIGYDLGLIVPADEAHLFSKARTGKKPIAGYGTQVGRKQYCIDAFFRKNDISLREKYFFADDIPDAKEFIRSNLKKGNDIMACYNDERLDGTGDWGHVCLISGIAEGTVFLIDPQKPHRERKVRLDKLLDAMRFHGRKKRDGLWIISKAEPETS